MKRVLYNNYLKFAASILGALAVAFSSYLLTTNFINEDCIYLFENSYNESFAAQNAVNKEVSFVLSRLLHTADQGGKLHLEKLTNMPSPDEWECYIKTNEGTYTNVENGSFDLSECGDISSNIGNFEYEDEYYEQFGSTYYYLYSNFDEEYELCIKMPQNVIEKNAAKWQSVKESADDASVLIIALLIFAATMFIYLLCSTGRMYGKEKIQPMLIDKMFVEITLALFLTILIGGGALIIIGAGYFLFEESISITKPLIAVAVFAVASLSLLLLLSIVRNLKNGTFLKHSLIYRICAFLLRQIKKFFTWLYRILSNLKRNILIVFAKNFDGRFAGVIIIAYSVVLTILTIITVFVPVFSVLLILFTLTAAVFVSKRLIGFAELKNGIEKIKNGDLDYKITDCPDGVIGQMAGNVNSIGGGLQKSLKREVKAERMKSELITNVSHDLKTPLTSIINYANLLSSEKLTPPEANDYAAIIKQKGERLKQLTNDLFDISKVQSGNEKFHIEDIDICLLVNQTMAELGEQIRKSGLDFRFKADAKAVFVKGDGKKLSRVFENLLINCVKYAMKSTRVYINITDKDKWTEVEIKNIAGYEMNFDESEITERFARGDNARSTEGSGLGLAIVKSYVEGCGGIVKVKKDGDLFKVLLSFVKS